MIFWWKGGPASPPSSNYLLGLDSLIFKPVFTDAAGVNWDHSQLLFFFFLSLSCSHIPSTDPPSLSQVNFNMQVDFLSFLINLFVHFSILPNMLFEVWGIFFKEERIYFLTECEVKKKGKCREQEIPLNLFSVSRLYWFNGVLLLVDWKIMSLILFLLLGFSKKGTFNTNFFYHYRLIFPHVLKSNGLCFYCEWKP